MSSPNGPNDVPEVKEEVRAAGGMKVGTSEKVKKQLSVLRGVDPNVCMVTKDGKQRRLVSRGKRNAAAVVDGTGSMGPLVNCLQRTSPRILGQSVYRQYADALSFGAIGDGRLLSERGAIQATNFISNPQAAVDLAPQLFMEAQGGDPYCESYQYAWYTYTHCVDFPDDAEKGFLFMIGDEGFYPDITAEELKRYFGVAQAGDISSEQLINDVKRMYHPFVFLFDTDCYGRAIWKKIREMWHDAFDPFVFEMGTDPRRLTDLMLGCMARTVGYSAADYDQHMTENKQSKEKQAIVRKFLDPVFGGDEGSDTQWGGEIQL